MIRKLWKHWYRTKSFCRVETHVHPRKCLTNQINSKPDGSTFIFLWVFTEVDKGIFADTQKMTEVVAAKAKLQGGRFRVLSRQERVPQTITKRFGRASISRSRRHSTPICRQNSRGSVRQRCLKALSTERAVTRWPGAANPSLFEVTTVLRKAKDRHQEVS